MKIILMPVGLIAAWATTTALAADTGRTEDCPATALIERWNEAAVKLRELPEASRQEIDTAQKTLSKSCPVCQETPDSFAFLGRFFDGSAESFVMGLAESSELSPEVWEQLRLEIQRRQEPKHD